MMLHDAQCEAELIEHHVGRYSGCACADRMEARLTTRIDTLTAVLARIRTSADELGIQVIVARVDAALDAGKGA
jgi:hypothetical protein